MRINQGVAIAFVVFLTFTLTVGITQYSFGVFVTEIEDDLGWSRAEITAAVSFFALAGIVALPAGWLLDRYGARPVMAVSIAALAVSQLLRPWMTEIWQFYALNAIQFAAMPGAVIITAARVVGEWFEENRGRAMGADFDGRELRRHHLRLAHGHAGSPPLAGAPRTSCTGCCSPPSCPSCSLSCATGRAPPLRQANRPVTATPCWRARRSARRCAAARSGW